MNRFAITFVAALGLALAGCSGDTGDTGDTGDSGDTGDTGNACSGGIECSTSAGCPVGQFCSGGCCELITICTPGSCEAGQFCDTELGECRVPAEACDFDGCECAIVGYAGQLQVGATPSEIVLAAGGSVDVDVLVSFVDGDPLPSAPVTLSVDSGPFTVAGLTLSADAGPSGAGTITASIDGLATAVTCSANVTNLGDAPADGNVRFYAFDDTSGAPIADVTLIVDNAGDGLDHGLAPVTGADGTSSTTVAPGGPYTVTAFKDGYNYLSIVGVTGTDIAVPLSARVDSPEVGGLTGRADFGPYEDRFLDGQSKALKVAIAASSFPLNALLNFDLSVLVGDIPDQDCDDDASLPGCYAIEFPGFDAIVAPLPGGIIAEIGTNVIKEHMDVQGIPGRRYAWTLAGEADISDLSDIIGLILPLVSDCTCDATPDVCDDSCTCDQDCGLPLDFGGVFNAVLPLLASFASGVQGNIALSGTPKADWDAYIAPEYDQRAPNSNYPMLDDGGDLGGKLPISEPLRQFGAYNVPDLPADPLAGANVKMEALILLTGVDVPGQGFVPLGFSAGIDCTAPDGACLDREANPDDFDGVVNGGTNCFFDPDPEDNTCPPGVPETVGPGQVGMYHAAAHSGLQAGDWVTIAVAAPLSALFADDAALRASAYVVRAEPETTASPTVSNQLDCANCGFPGYPTLDALVDGGVYEVGGGEADVHWVTFGGDSQGSGVTTRWNVWLSGAGASFTAPDPNVWNATAVNPIAAADGNGDIPLGHVNVTQIGFELGGTTLEDLASNNGTSVADVLSELDGFGVVSDNVCADAITGCP